MASQSQFKAVHKGGSRAGAAAEAAAAPIPRAGKPIEFKRDMLYSRDVRDSRFCGFISGLFASETPGVPNAPRSASPAPVDKVQPLTPALDFDLATVGISVQPPQFEEEPLERDPLNSSIIRSFGASQMELEKEAPGHPLLLEPFSEADDRECYPETALDQSNVESKPDVILGGLDNEACNFAPTKREDSEEGSVTPGSWHGPSTPASVDGAAIPCCSCKRSKCLKLYCECFARQNGCSSLCSCQGCYNRPEFEEIRKLVIEDTIDKNPLAFSSKFEENQTTVKHTRGCNCRKTGCQKRYCECFTAGVPCTELCRCCTCSNNKVCGEGAPPAPRSKRISKTKKPFIDSLIDKLKLMRELEKLGQ